MSRTGARVLVDQLRIHGVDLAFGVPGESYLAVLDALHDTPELRYVVCRQEGGAAAMAEAYGKLTGRPGVCLVTRGPGATNATIGVHTARQDSTPLVLLVGDVPRGHRGREAFQEVDFPAFFGPLVKWAAVVDEAARLPELVRRAFQTAASGRPGPVVLALPEDVLVELTDAADAPAAAPVQAHPGDLGGLARMLAGASRPLVLLGGGGWTPAAAADVAAFGEAWRLPLAAAWRRQDLVDNESPCYVGDVGLGMDPHLARRVRAADLLLVVGSRLEEITTGGYDLVEPPTPRQTLVHVHQDPGELGRVYAPELAICSGLAEFAAAARALPASAEPAWADWTAAARAEHEANRRHEPRTGGDAVDLGAVALALPEDAIVTNGAGNYAGFAHRYHRFRRYPSQLAPGSGAMGYGLPAAIAARCVERERPVVCFTGDGDFLMTGQELATAVQYELPLVVLVSNNGMYGTIRMHQERAYPGRVSATELRNPDFAAYARAFGAHGEVVERQEDFAAAFARALAAGRPAVLDLHVDPEVITTRATLTELREAALGAG